MQTRKNRINISKKKMNHGIQVTEQAIRQISNLIKKNILIKGVRIDIKKSGCAGFKYNLKLVSSKEKGDIVFIVKKIEFYIPFKKIKIIENTKIHYSKNGLNYIFSFENIKTKNLCGCGESFNI